MVRRWLFPPSVDEKSWAAWPCQGRTFGRERLDQHDPRGALLLVMPFRGALKTDAAYSGLAFG